jgi:hypothetical protein
MSRADRGAKVSMLLGSNTERAAPSNRNNDTKLRCDLPLSSAFEYKGHGTDKKN